VLGISRQAIWKLQRRHPGLLAWVDEVVKNHNANYFALVKRKMAFLGMQGSVAHAEAFFKSLSGAYSTRPLGLDELPAAAVNAFQMNFLIPRPAGQAALPPAPSDGAVLPGVVVPTVAVGP
jgi:hypothetical protein